MPALSPRLSLAGLLLLASCGGAGGTREDAPSRSRSGLGADCFQLTGDAQDFGAREQLCRADRAWTLTNTCASSVTVQGVALNAPGGDFALTQSPAIPEGGLQVPPQGQLAVAAAFRPNHSGLLGAEVALTAGGTTATWPLQGTGEAVSFKTESYTAPDEAPMSDLLVVIDNGPELEPLLPSLRQNLRSFIQYAVSSRADARLGFTTVAGVATAAPAELIPAANGERFIDARAPDFEAGFESILSALSLGPSSHASFDTAIAALELTGPGGVNASFPRPEAWDAFLFISAHREQSARTPVQVLNRLREETGRLRRRVYLSVDVIAPILPYSPCVDAQDDGSFQWLSTWTNGVEDSICTPDWSKSLEALGKTSFGFRTEILLHDSPDFARGELRVSIDGTDVPDVDYRGATVWRYDGERNSVVFEPMYSPEPNQTVQLDYPVYCPN